jgi:hypothetical protein
MRFRELELVRSSTIDHVEWTCERYVEHLKLVCDPSSAVTRMRLSSTKLRIRQ